MLAINAPTEYVSSSFYMAQDDASVWAAGSAAGCDPHAHVVTVLRAAIDESTTRLRDWYRCPEAFADDETDTPSRVAIVNAARFINTIKHRLENTAWIESSRLTPLNAVTIGTGGSVVLEFSEGDGRSVTFEFEPSGQTVCYGLHDGEVVWHRVASV